MANSVYIVPGVSQFIGAGGLTINSGDNSTSFIAFGANPSTTGQIRMPHASEMKGRNAANSADNNIISWGAVSNELQLGDAGRVVRLRTSLAAPGTLANGDWWVECVGTSPSRVCAIKVRDAGSTRTIASLTY